MIVVLDGLVRECWNSIHDVAPTLPLRFGRGRKGPFQPVVIFECPGHLKPPDSAAKVEELATFLQEWSRP